MKTTLWAITTCSMWLFSNPSFSRPILPILPPIEMPAPINAMYVPSGFDSNDITEVIVTGFLKNSCQQIGQGRAMVDHKEKVIAVYVPSFEVKRDICIEMKVPFVKSVKIGHLQPMTYSIQTVNHPSITSTISIKESTTTSTEDYLYLPVDFADVLEMDGQQKLFLTGRFPEIKDGCMKVEQAIINIEKDSHMVIVQPVGRIEKQSNCTDENTESYQQFFDMPKKFTGKGILHVRTLGGGSYNRTISLPESTTIELNGLEK